VRTLDRLPVVTQRRRVLILSASIGGGHVAAARALETAFGATGEPCLHVDLLDYTSAPFRRVYRRAYLDLVRNAPDLVEWLGKRLDRRPSELPSPARRVRARLTRLVSYQLPRVMERYRPDLIVHTHYLPPEILSSLRRPNLPRQTVVVTDYGAHALWLTRGIERYFVAAEEVAVHLRASGVDAERVEVTGIPIDPRFAHLPSREQARELLGLGAEREMLLMMAGGMQRRTLEALMHSLGEVRWPLDVWVVCGRSPELLDVANEAVAEMDGLVRVRPIGYTSDVPLFMAAADLIAGKPGGLTASEALAAGLPFAIVQPYPIQEESNASYLLEQGAAVRIEPLTTFGHKLGLLLADTGRRATMRQAALRIARPGAADAVVASCRALLEAG